MITLAITNYNRFELLFESFYNVIGDDRISEIVIVDDCSDAKIFEAIERKLEFIPNEKIKLYRNEHNLGCYHNKLTAVHKASNEWVILLDSDNIITKEYIDALFSRNWFPKRLFQPTFAKPHFDFRKYLGLDVTKENVHQYAGDATFTTALNAMNYFVNRDEYLRVWELRPEPWTADSLLQNYNWLNAGNEIYFCPGLQYEHRVHDGSHYKEHNRKTGNLYNELVNKLKAMR